MTSKKGKRLGKPDVAKLAIHQIKRGVEVIKASEMPAVEEERIFDNEHQVILVEGGRGKGKTTYAYHLCQKWAKDNLNRFDIVAFISLCDEDIESTSTLPDLLLLACGRDVIGLTKEMIKQLIKSDLRLLLILDGWDEALAHIREKSFVINILKSLPLKSKIMITSRPACSVDLHDLAYRIEITGFNKESIHKYFQKVFHTQLDPDMAEDWCRELKEHFHNHPVIQDCCSIPLNAAIIAHLFLEKKSLDLADHELFLDLVRNHIIRELKRQKSPIFVSSLSKLPFELKEKFDDLCKLAFVSEKQNEMFFSQQELVNLKLPADISDLGLLQKDDISSLTGSRERPTYCFFDHFSIREFLAAYHISHLEEDEQEKVFQDLHDKPQFSAVLQFYAGFIQITHEEIEKYISDSGSHLTFIRRFYRAKMADLALCEKFLSRHDKKLNLSNGTLSPLDCMSVGYFLAFGFEVSGELSVYLSSCSIDDHSLNLLLENLRLSKHGKPGVSQGQFKELNLSRNKIGDKGIAHIATALQEKKITVKTLDCSDCNISSAEEILRLLTNAKHSVKELELKIRENRIGKGGIEQILDAVETNVSNCVIKCETDSPGNWYKAKKVARGMLHCPIM